MAAVLGRTQIEIKKTGSQTTVSDNPIARLMYYFDCVSSCVEPDQNNTIRRLRDYKNYSSLSSEEEAQLLVLCLALSPDKLINSIFFPVQDRMDFDGCSNEFFSVSSVNTKLVVAESLLIGGQQKKVQKIMMFKKSWIEKNYLNPFRSIESGGQRRALPSSSRPRPRNDSCIIL